MQLNYAMICIDCEEIFDARHLKNGRCPRCASEVTQPLSAWVRSTARAAAVVVTSGNGGGRSCGCPVR